MAKTKVLVTGATGNVGKAVINALLKQQNKLAVFAGVRRPEDALRDPLLQCVQPVFFDFEKPESYTPALVNCDVLFLLRPPQLADVKKFIKPLVRSAVAKEVEHIVFLSVQGAEDNRFIPHHKIEKLILNSGISYTFLRPAYFMQNFTTTLHDDLVKNSRIFLPAGKAKFTLIDVRDIGEVAAVILAATDRHVNKAYDLTSNEALNFKEMAEKLSDGLNEQITYVSPGLLQFYREKRKENTPVGFILVMMMLHFLPRFQKQPPLTDCVKMLTGNDPITFEQFVLDHRNQLLT